jgi:hypothetical protein
VRIKCLAAFILTVIAVEGCSDDVTAPAPPIRPSLSLGIGQGAMKISHAPIRQRFGGITIDALTPVQVGAPVVIEVTAPVIVASNSVHLKLLLPELAEIAFRQKFGANKSGPRVAGPHLEWRGAASRGPLRQTARLVFPVPGLYRVSAQLATDDPTLDAGEQIQNAAGTVSWIYVTEKRGRVIHSFANLYTDREASQAPTPVDTYLADPQGAIGIASIPLPCDPYDPSCSPCEVDPYSCEPVPDPTPPAGAFTGTLLYENQRVHQTMGLANALMTIFDDYGVWSSSVLTDANGKFTLQCPAASLRGHLQMVATARNDFTEVLDVNSPAPPPDLSYYRPQADAAIDKCGTDTGTYIAGKPAQAELFDNITRSAIKSRATFSGFSRGQIKVHWKSGTVDSASAYSPTDDVIEIYEVRSVGEVGLFEAAHEYGHALHQVAMGGIIISAGNASGCQAHNLGGITNYQCAFVEGFADYHAVALWGVQVGAALFNVIDQGRYVGYPTNTGGRLVGPQTEGAVAATLLHVGDGTGTRSVTNAVYGTKSYSDGVSLGHGQVASAIRDCRITRSDYTTVQADGIDYLAYCLEKAVKMVSGGTSCNYWKICTPLPAYFMAVVDPGARDIAFAGLRSFLLAGRMVGPAPATSWAWGAVPTRSGYDTAMRTVWLCNLFFCA